MQFKTRKPGLLIMHILIFGLYACSSDAEETMADGLVGPGGGVVELNGVKLEVPEGALTESITISVDKADQPTDEEYQPVGQFYRIKPQGQTFAKAIKISMAYEIADGAADGDIDADNSQSNIVIITATEYGANWSTLDIADGENSDTMVTGMTDHFSLFGPVISYDNNADGDLDSDVDSIDDKDPAMLVDGFIDFGEVDVGERKTIELAITNQGEGELKIAGFELSESANGAFELADMTSTTIRPASSQMVLIYFTPQVSGKVSGKMLINSNDPDQPEKEIDLYGSGVLDETPESDGDSEQE